MKSTGAFCNLKSIQSNEIYVHFDGLHYMRHKDGVSINVILWIILIGYQRLKTDGVGFAILYLYIYRYNTILVNKVEGFHIADSGTELKFYFFPPKHA